MSGFKLIAIRTGNALSEEEIQSFKNFLNPSNSRSIPAPYNYLKNLEPNKTFYLFNDYSLDADNNVLTYLPEKSIPNIYNLKKNTETRLSVSAIVGKNGSGKSTLLEILYVAIHNLAVATEVLYDSNMIKVEYPQSYLRCELYVLTDAETSYKIKFDDKAPNPCIISKATKHNNKFKYQKFPYYDKSILKELFYSVAVNYSIYGLNSKHLGSWITHLFHKNDSYQTPLVINPMRTDGNFDINREEYLSKYRLLSNSIIKYKTHRDVITIVDDIKLEKLIFKLDKNKINNLESERVFKHGASRESEDKIRTVEQLIEESKLGMTMDEIATLAVKTISGKNVSDNIFYKNEAQKYIIKKLYRIAFNYNKYWKYLDYGDYPIPIKFLTNFNVIFFEDYLRELAKDTTHVTLKLRQALNYLMNNPLGKSISRDGSIEYEFKEIMGGNIYEIPFVDFAEKLLTYDEMVIRCIPPSLFDIVIMVSDEAREDDKSFDIKCLSSGQLQLIYSIQSSLYHINNLESYKGIKDERVKYKNVLILFDEVELYFHPEYQRKIVDSFIRQLDELNFKQIKNIHVIYVTHSPFILSDIPNQNILKLEKGEPKEYNSVDKTFGANIYSLLDDTFYMNNTIGEFAEKKMKWLLSELQEGKREKKHEIWQTIELIGESIIREQFENLFYEEFEDHGIDILKQRIIELERKLNEDK